MHYLLKTEELSHFYPASLFVFWLHTNHSKSATMKCIYPFKPSVVLSYRKIYLMVSSAHRKNGSVCDTCTLLVCIGTSECVLHAIFVSICTPHVCHAHLSF